MTDLFEFLDEDELLAEFHAAGILLPEEAKEIQRRREAAEAAHKFQQALMGVGDSHIAVMQRAMRSQMNLQGQQDLRMAALQQQSRLVAGQFPPANPFSASLLGNILSRSIL